MSTSYPSMHVQMHFKTKLLASLKVVQHGSVPLIQLLPLGFSEHEKDLVLTAINGLLSGTNVGTSGVLLPPKRCMLDASKSACRIQVLLPVGKCC